MSRFAVILPAAGKSSRFRDAHYKKTFAPLDNRPVWLHSAERFIQRDDVKQVLVVISPEDKEEFLSKFGANVAILGIEVVEGGAERTDSVQKALEQLRADVEYVAIHDAARPCIADEWIDRVFAAAQKTGAAMLAIPVTGTLKRVAADQTIEATVSREGLWEAQTPQVFRRDLLLKAYASRGQKPATDDAELVERLGQRVTVVPGSPINIKITTKEDLHIAAWLLKAMPKPKALGGLHPFDERFNWTIRSGGILPPNSFPRFLPMARNEQLIRQHKILQILERTRFGKTLEEIRDDLLGDLGLSSLHVRTVRRDLEALQAAGIDVAAHDSPRGKLWKFGPQAKEATPITASATELIAVSLSRDLLYPLAGTPFWQGIESFWNKIRDALPSAVWNHYEKNRRVLCVRGMPAKSYESHHGILSTISRSIQEHRVVEVEYQKPDVETARVRKIEPLAVAFYQSSLYIVAGACELPEGEGRIRHFKLDRFKKATALDEWFKPPDNFDPQAHLDRSLGIFTGEDLQEYRIRISPRGARFVMEDPWHENQKIEQLEDGAIILQVFAGHELDVITRVLALGDQAEVLEPESCRQAIAEIVDKLAAVYGTPARP